MRKKLYSAILLAVILVQAAAFPAFAKEFDYKSKEFKAVASQFSCTCGCGQDHYECDPNTCNLTVEFKKDLVDMMNKGMDKDEIRAYYIGIYGEEILTAPEKEGFSLTAWVLPFVALGGAGTALVFVIRKWVRKKGQANGQIEEETGRDEVESEILSSIIDEERKKYL
ncbi:cytochrome c-type biogenesis protein CcmH [Neobacillus piezotolerans]|uniref:Cytochrome c-type biogenesis protein n=1 Tax=Neobacillus piezotolerans TaxID=2259171 RepID=A0A3D8GLC5_9BACI|nr:cytochrome c-type biogenesis protein [Neobacillus piezotolerans]RDU35151.1 cytochrome c-type biogenesis protein CcmH [Neobacillus piezotolerans]